MKNLSPKVNSYHLWVIISIFLGALLAPMMASNISHLSLALINGECQKITPHPLYNYYHIDSSNPDFANITFAADFSNVYFTAKNFQKRDIYTGKYDPAKRPVLYPPFLYYIYRHTFCHFTFGEAALWHLLSQILLLFLSTYFILRYYHLRLMFLPLTVTYSALLFFTPLGLSELERGQFDIYSALSILWFLFAFYERKNYAFVLAALFASLKWTSAPFFFQAFLIYLLVGKNKSRFKFFALFTGTFLLTLILFPQHITNYLSSLYNTQIFHQEGDISLVDKTSPLLLYLLPSLSPLLYALSLIFNKRDNIFLLTFLPFMSALAVLDLLIPSSTYQYRAIYLLGFLPMTLVWMLRLENDSTYQTLFIFLFVTFIFFVFHCLWMIKAIEFKAEYCIPIYLAFYFIVASISLLKNARSSKGQN